MIEPSDNNLSLYAQRALWSNVPPTLRSASIEFRDGVIFWRCLFDKNASTDDFELLSVAGTEILADFPDVSDFKEELKIIPYPEKLDNLKNLVFYRHEHNYHKE